MHNFDDIKEQILSQIDLVDYISEAVELHKRGSNYVGLCPFHSEKTPSFTVSSEKGIFKCFGCGVSGNAFTFAMKYYGLTFKEALNDFANRLGIVLPKSYDRKDKNYEEKEICLKALETAAEYYHSLLLTSSAGRFAYKYLSKRGYKIETIQSFKLGYSPDSFDATANYLKSKGFDEKYLIKTGLIVINEENNSKYDRFRNRLMFPIHNVLGKIVGFGARILTEDPNQPKYINSPQTDYYDKSNLLYGFYQAKNEIRAKKFAILVEGYADVISLHQAGFKTTVASSGTSLTKNQLKLLSSICKKIYICFDSDEAGRKATQKAIEQALEFGFDLRIVKLPQGEDPDSIIQNLGQNVFRTYLEEATDFLEFVIDIHKDENDIDSPLTKSELSKYLAKLIIKIPDNFQHDDYLQKVCYKLRLSDNQREQFFNYAYNLRKANIIEKENELMEDDNLSDLKDKLSSDLDKIELKIDEKIEMLLEERWILKSILENEQLFSILINKFQFKIDNFYSNSAKKVFNIIEKCEKKGKISLSLICSDEEISEDERNLIIDVALYDNKPSENWKRFRRNYEEVDLIRTIRECLIKIELHKINDKIENLQKMLLNLETSEALNILNDIQNLNKRKIKLIEMLGVI